MLGSGSGKLLSPKLSLSEHHAAWRTIRYLHSPLLDAMTRYQCVSRSLIRLAYQALHSIDSVSRRSPSALHVPTPW